jgi:transcriptional regulator with XRE-family HTH domain
MTTAALPLAAPAQYTPTPFVVPQRGCGLDELLASHTAWMRLPSTYADLLRQINELTGWSFRDIAEIVGTSHTTVGKLANGAVPTSRSADAAERIAPMYDVLVRVSRLVAPGPDLAAVLEQSTADGESPREVLRSGEWSRALLTAMDVINGPRPARPQLRPGVRRERGTQELH